MNEILAFWAPGPIELIIILVIGLVFFVIPLIVVIVIVTNFISKGRENQRLRLEVDKLADELQQVRKQLEENNER